MHFQSCVSATSVHELLFADHSTLHVTSKEYMQRSMDPFAAAYGSFGLVINAEETVLIHQRSPDAAYVSPQINANGGQLKVVDNFTYLGSTLYRNTEIDDDLARRIFTASQTFGRLRSSLESIRSSHQHQTENLQIGHPADASVWRGDLDGI
nr:unnamed protein product [Spirometra erinaceieuropaei]